MKTNTILMTALAAAIVGMPTFAAGSAQVQPEAVVETAYKAAQVTPANAAEVFKSAMSQRASWSKADVYSVYNAVLMGANLKGSFTKDWESYTKGINQQDPGVKLIVALKEVCDKMPANTFNAVVSQLSNDANGVNNLAEHTSLNQQGVNTNGPVGICNTPRRDPRPHPTPVTPEPISPQN